MTFKIPIRSLLELRHEHGDKLALDLLELATIAHQPGFVATAELMQRWRVSQPSVSRRLSQLSDAGLVDLTVAYGGIQVHAIALCEEMRHAMAQVSNGAG